MIFLFDSIFDLTCTHSPSGLYAIHSYYLHGADYRQLNYLYAAIGVDGNYKTEMAFGGEIESETETIEWGDDDAYYKRLDCVLLWGVVPDQVKT